MFAPTSANLELTDRAVREAALDRLTKHLPLHVEGWHHGNGTGCPGQSRRDRQNHRSGL